MENNEPTFPTSAVELLILLDEMAAPVAPRPGFDREKVLWDQSRREWVDELIELYNEEYGDVAFQSILAKDHDPARGPRT